MWQNFTEENAMALTPAYNPRESSAFLCQDLASAAVTLFRDPQAAGTDKVALQNIYRLLEMYRFDAFVGYNPKGVLELRKVSAGAEVNIAGGEILRRALDIAKNTVFPNTEKEIVVDRLERLVSEMARQDALDMGEQQNASRFFQELSTALEAA